VVGYNTSDVKEEELLLKKQKKYLFNLLVDKWLISRLKK